MTTVAPNNRIKRGDRRARQNKSSGNKPPQLQSNVTLSHRYRFTSTSGTATPITVASLLLASGTVAATSNLVYSPFFSVKVNKVDIYAPPASQGAASTCSIEWFGGLGSMGNQEISDTSNSVSTPARVSSRPPRLSQASFWNNAIHNVNLFTLIAPAGSIIDVMLSLIMFDDSEPAGSSNPVHYTTGAAATVGDVYFLALDQPTSSIYTPVSLTTIV